MQRHRYGASSAAGLACSTRDGAPTRLMRSVVADGAWCSALLCLAYCAQQLARHGPHGVSLMQATARSAASAATTQKDSAAGHAAPSDAATPTLGSDQHSQGRPPSPQIEKPIEVGPACALRSSTSCIILGQITFSVLPRIWILHDCVRTARPPSGDGIRGLP